MRRLRNHTEFQLGIFPRVLRPALTVLRPALIVVCRTPLCPARIAKNDILCSLCFQTEFADLCPCFHRSPTNLCPNLVSFVCWIVIEFWAFVRKSVSDLIVHALDCTRFCVVCALNCIRVEVVRTLFLLHTALFPTCAEH